MAMIGSIAIGMSVNTNRFSRDLNKAREQISTFDSVAGKASLALKGMFAGFAAKEVGGAILDMTRKAASLQEGVNKLDAVFGTSSESVRKYARSMSDEFGISVNEVVADVGRMGSMLTGAGFGRDVAAEMSKSLVTMANDLSRFNDTSFEVAFQKLRSGLSGESEPLRDFGVFLDEDSVKTRALAMGLGGLGGKLDATAKIQARANLIMTQAKDAIGAAAREADGTSAKLEALSGRWETLKATIGESFAPAVGSAVGGVNEVLSSLTAAWKADATAARKWGEDTAKAAGVAKEAMQGAASANDLSGKWSLTETALGGLANLGNAEKAGVSKALEGFLRGGATVSDWTAGWFSPFARETSARARKQADRFGKVASDWWNDPAAGARAISEQKRQSQLSATAIAGAATPMTTAVDQARKTLAGTVQGIAENLKAGFRGGGGILGAVGRAFGPDAAVSVKAFGGAVKAVGGVAGPLGSLASRFLDGKRSDGYDWSQATTGDLSALGTTIANGILPGVNLAGMIRSTEFAKVVGDAGLDRSPGPRDFAGAYTLGSREATSIALKDRGGSDGPASETAKNTAKMATNTAKSADALSDIKKGINDLAKAKGDVVFSM